MKKIFGLGLIMLTLSLMLTGCGDTKKQDNLGLSVKEIIDKVYNNLNEDELPKMGNTEITKENMEYYLGVNNLDIIEGVASEPLRSSTAHSVVVFRVNDGVDVEQAKKDIKEKVDPRKWICVEAEQVIVESRGNVIILIMSTNDLSSKIQANFNSLK